jgi:ADP-heptose:LPS heptosyltransferase
MLTGEVRQRPLTRFAIINRYDQHIFHEVWENHPRIARPGEPYDETLKICGRHRPYIVSQTRDQYVWREYQPPPGEFFFTPEETAFGLAHAGRVILEPNLKRGAPAGKSWGWMRWNKLAWMLQKRGIRITQMGMLGTPVVDEAEFIHTPRFRLAAAVIAHARVVVTHEGAFHHTAAAVGVPCIVVRGAFVGRAVTGYAGQIDFGEAGLGCGIRGACKHCQDAMTKIKPEEVFDSVMGIL